MWIFRNHFPSQPDEENAKVVKMHKYILMLSHGKSVIPNFLVSCRSNDKS